ncbi:MAG: hypothetical protein FJX25_09890 [Alphaproteobacteria bacterium]|nr:hypothetical protein [Alphaproteobacteria bacterium]
MTYDPTLETQMRLWVNEEEIVFPDKSALFIKTSIAPIEGAVKFRRTVNGTLVNMSNPAFNKWIVSVSGTDKILPALADVPPGAQAMLYLPTVVREAGPLPRRQPVPGSLISSPQGIEYRPIVYGAIIINPMSDTEWMSDVEWSFDVEEW